MRKQISPVELAKVDTQFKYMSPAHILEINRFLLQIAERKIKRFAVFLPPRHGKSELISKYFTAWYLATHPDDRVILASYEADFAATWGAKARNIIETHGSDFKDNITIDENSKARNRWDIKDHNGGMMTAGVGGPITGKGADLLIIDDPVKNFEEANSATYRDKAWDWYTTTAYTRLEPDGAIILIQTRWHEDDLAGRILANSKEDWVILELPALDEHGHALWPERFNTEDINNIKEEIGSYQFEALYQQHPQPATGGLLKRDWLDYYDKKGLNIAAFTKYTGWDLAISTKQTADYTCSCTVAHNTKTNDIYVRDWTRDHITFPEQLSMVNSQYDKYHPMLIGIETNAYQAALPQQLLKDRILPIRNMPSVKDKVTRITSTFTMFEQGKVHLPKDHPLLDEFEKEYTTFPRGTHDDLLDATEMAISLCSQGGGNPYGTSGASYEFSRARRNKQRR